MNREDDNLMNRLGNSKNGFQGKYKKVLCVCSAGILRSPTAAVVLSHEPYSYNTRAVGMEETYALFPIDKVHIYWSDEIVVMTEYQKEEILRRFKNEIIGKTIVVLNIPDKFSYREPELVRLIKANYNLGVSNVD